MKPTTLEEALLMVPTHWLLTPGVDVWQDGDEVLDCDYDKNGLAIPLFVRGSLALGTYLRPDDIGRRPIPQDVRESAAWWLLYNTLATVDPIPRFEQLLARFIITTYGDDIIELNVEPEAEFSGMRGFDGESKVYASIKALGGEKRVIKELSAGPDPLGRWILAGKP